MKRFRKYYTFLRKLLENPKWMAYPVVWVLIGSICLLILLATYMFIDLIIYSLDFSRNTDFDVHYVSAQIIRIADTFVLMTGLLIFATSMYKFFIGPIKQNSAVKINNLGELKSSIAKVIVLFLVTYLAHEIVDFGINVNTIYNAIAITLGCFILIWYIVATKGKGKTHGKDKN